MNHDDELAVNSIVKAGALKIRLLTKTTSKKRASPNLLTSRPEHTEMWGFPNYSITNIYIRSL